MFSLKTYRGVAVHKGIDMLPLVRNIGGILWPILMYMAVRHICHNVLEISLQLDGVVAKNPDYHYSEHLVIPYLISPWTISCAIHAIQPIISTVQSTWAIRHVKRPLTLPEAWERLYEVKQDKRVIRKQRYDVYLPPKEKGRRKVTSEEAIILLPGAYVEDTAYAIPASKLSDEGYLVVVPSAEPLRLSFPKTSRPAMVEYRFIMKKLGKKFKVKTWHGVGHSLGSFTLSSIGPRLGLSKMIFWASSPLFVEYLSDLSGMSEGDNLLILRGSSDIWDKKATKDQQQQYSARLPRAVKRATIMGGTHGGFASYFERKDDDSTAKQKARSRQHDRAVRSTVKFLKNEKESFLKPL